jgi:hypothetical protein
LKACLSSQDIQPKNQTSTPYCRHDEIDQIARARRELLDGTFMAHARCRARRRKSPWNLLLFLLMFAAWWALGFLLAWLGASLHAALHPGQAPMFGPGSNRLSTMLVLLPSLFGTLAPGFLLANLILHALPPARRALNAEAQTVPGTGYGESQRTLLKVGWRILAVCAPVWLLGVLLG